jgi:hypothetical protein
LGDKSEGGASTGRLPLRLLDEKLAVIMKI